MPIGTPSIRYVHRGVAGILRRMTTSRLEAFSDGVLAIAATLLILNVHANGPHLGRALARVWPSYAAYAVSFVTIGIMWVNHHGVFAQIDKVDRTFLMINVFFLMAVAFVPFPTVLVADYLHDPGLEVAALAYGFTLTATAVLYNLLWFYAARRRRLLRSDADPRIVSGMTRQLSAWAVDLSGSYPPGVVEADRERGPLCSNRRVVHGRERRFRAPGARCALALSQARRKRRVACSFGWL